VRREEHSDLYDFALKLKKKDKEKKTNEIEVSRLRENKLRGKRSGGRKPAAGATFIASP